MVDCKNLIHPFQNDPGVSQRQRVMEDLLSGQAHIDGRSLADLLDYFMQLSRHINFYEADLSVSDWQPFFQKSTPFTIAAITKFNSDAVSEKFAFYQQLFNKHPSASGLQLLVHYLYYSVINTLNTWHLQVQGSELPVAFALEKLIRDKLRNPVTKFIGYTNAAVKGYCIKPVDWQRLYNNEVWDLDIIELYTVDETFKDKANTKRERTIALYHAISGLFPAFLDVMRVVADAAALSVEPSLLPLKAELQEKHQPHLALLFAFLKLFQHLQNDLNSYTKKHLDFFYKQVLQLKSQEAAPDKVHIVLEIQNQLDKYLLRKGLQVKDGKDNNKAEVFFALDDEIVVNKTQVADKRTLFLNYQTYPVTTYLEGVYMAPNADKADGIDKDFKDDAPQSFATLGAKNSKYIGPENKFVQPYPNARLGFLLASPVLFLNEGRRNITIKLACRLDKLCEEDRYPHCFPPEALYNKVRKLAGKIYHLISQDLILEASKRGIKPEITEKLWDFLRTGTKEVCDQEVNIYQQQLVITARKWRHEFYNALQENEKVIMDELFKPRRIFRILLSGKEEWIEPSHIKKIRLYHYDAVNKTFAIKVRLILKPDKKAVTFYDKEKLKEDFNTSLPLVKIELDDDIKMLRGLDLPPRLCCITKPTGNKKRPISFYHFFRHVRIEDKINADETKIEVRVCGLKNFIVQNDESVQDVNSPIYPFGTRPNVAPFDLLNPIPPVFSENVGPHFYIGNKEVFCKKWDEVFINLNWKDKPQNFNEYYKAYWVDPLDATNFGISEENFQINVALLEEGTWKKEKTHILPSPPPANTVPNAVTNDNNRPLFKDDGKAIFCNPANPFEQTIYLSKDYIDGISPKFCLNEEELSKYEVDTPDGFIRINLQNQDFLHKNYSFVLARQMTAFGKLPDEHVEGAVYYDPASGGGPIVISTSNMLNAINNAGPIAHRANLDVQQINNIAGTNTHNITLAQSNSIRSILRIPNTPNPGDLSLNAGSASLDNTINTNVIAILNNLKNFAAIIPNEPWTPIIKEISLDYTATASITDIDLIHLYPYQDTYKAEELELQPTLLPTFCDEGTLFLGLQDLVPGSNVNMLFQLAEATADSESEREEVKWYYLDDNQWKMLREGFEVLDDATDGLTTSGIIKFALPANMSSDNTILPKGLHWIKAAIPQNSRSVSETIGILTQAIQVIFTNEEANDKLRLTNALPAGSIAKLKEADAAVKKISQPYDGFGGRVPEAAGHFYVRVSELLRHKGRAIQKFDYERLALEAFPQLFKVKCVNHSFALDAHRYVNDFPVAPGYVLLAVIPDLNQLKASATFEPRVPVSLLEKVKEYLRQRTSPFVRLRIMNPRYEKVHFSLQVKLYLGRDENFYKEKLIQDLREFLAPWAVGQYDKLTFGQCIYRSDFVRFLESRDYLDYILDLKMKHEDDAGPLSDSPSVCPLTPRSILIAGDVDVCIQQHDCETWEKCYDDNQQERDCCGHEKMVLADYCNETSINE